jgi:hypothetical protein
VIIHQPIDAVEEDPGPLVDNHQLVARLQQALIDAPRDIQGVRLTLASVLRHQAWADRFDPVASRRYTYPKGERDAFIRFIADPLPEGLASDEETIRRLIKDDPRLLTEFDLATRKDPGGGNNPEGLGGKSGKTVDDIVNHYPIMIDNPPAPSSNGHAANGHAGNGDTTPPPGKKPRSRQGTSAAYWVRRLAALADEQKQDLSDPAEIPPAGELLGRVKAGELKPKQAARLAGFIQGDPDWREAELAFRRMNREAQERFAAWCRDNVGATPRPRGRQSVSA